MFSIGFKSFIIKLFYSLTPNRKFCVQFKNRYSEYSSLNRCVSPCYILAPHLYSRSMSDFPHNEIQSLGILYADDSLNVLQYVTCHLTKVEQFHEDWGIKLNASKSEAICLRNASGKCKRYMVCESKPLKLSLDDMEILSRIMLNIF